MDSCPPGPCSLLSQGPASRPRTPAPPAGAQEARGGTLQHENRKTKTQKTVCSQEIFLTLSFSKKREALSQGGSSGNRGQAGSRPSTSHGTGPRKARLGGSLALALAGPPVSSPYVGSQSRQRKAFSDPSCKPPSPAPTPTRPSVLAACRALGAEVSPQTALDLLWISLLRANASSKPNQPGEGTVPAVVTHPGTLGRKAFPCFCCPKCTTAGTYLLSPFLGKPSPSNTVRPGVPSAITR